MTPVSTIHRPNTLTYSTAPTVHQDSPRTTRSRLGAAVLRFRAGWWCVLGGVLLSRTLAGAVPSALSGLASGFGMDAGRFPVAVTTETTTWAVRGRRLVRVYSVVRVTAPSQPTLTRVCAWCVWLVVRVGCGPYSGRFAFTVSLTPAFPRTLGVWRVLGCCCLCWPISTSQLTDRCRSSTPGLSTQ